MALNLGLSIDEIERIAGFLGYGRSAGSVWFIGIEEGLGNMNSDEAMRNLKARAQFDPVMDLYQAHLQLRAKGALIDFNRRIPDTQVWKFMAKIMLAREGRSDWTDKAAVNEYIRTRLGRSDGQTFLTELSPIPAGRGSDKQWIRAFEQKDQHFAHKLWMRREKLKQLLKDAPPRLVICYRLPSAGEFAELLGITWQRVNEQIFKATNPNCLLLPFFGQGHMSRSVIEELVRTKLLA